MRKYVDIAAEFPEVEQIEPKCVWYAYNQGKATECSTSNEARTISNIVEKVLINGDAVATYKRECKMRENAIFDQWYKELRQEHGDLPLATFKECYNFVYNISHTTGYDNIAATLVDVVSFAERLLQLQQELNS